MEKSEFTKRVQQEYWGWRSFVTGDSESVEVPFFPIASFDKAILSEFVSELISQTIAPDFNMLSVITQRKKPLFMLVERVKGGRFVSIEVINPIPISEAKEKYKASLVKSVERSVLEKAFSLQDRYKNTLDKRTYVLELTVLLTNALKKKTLVFSPTPRIIKSLLRAIRNVRVDITLLTGLRDYIASIEIVSGKRSMLLNLGTPLRIVIKKDYLLKLIRDIEEIRDLQGLMDISLNWLADGFKDYLVRVEPASFIWRGVGILVKHDAERVARKTKFMLSMLADPLNMLIMIDKDAYMLVFKNGVISSIGSVESKDGDLRKTWLELSRNYGFVHLAFKSNPTVLERAFSRLNLNALFKKEVVEFYPKNEFVAHLNDLGVLKMLLRLVYPFIKH
ncbi:MAG: hypothetical protein ABIG39_02445 [Candidatus Micrarchaeota archaeon]